MMVNLECDVHKNVWCFNGDLTFRFISQSRANRCNLKVLPLLVVSYSLPSFTIFSSIPQILLPFFIFLMMYSIFFILNFVTLGLRDSLNFLFERRDSMEFV